MSTSISSGAFSTFSANNAHLYSSSRNAFAIHQNNNFIKANSPKLQVNKLTTEQQKAIKTKLKSYGNRENRSALVSAALTLVISAGVLILSSELLSSII